MLPEDKMPELGSEGQMGIVCLRNNACKNAMARVFLVIMKNSKTCVFKGQGVGGSLENGALSDLVCGFKFHIKDKNSRSIWSV